MSLTKETFVNTLAAASSHITGSILTLLLTPFLLYAVGVQQYGLWALFGALTRFAWIADLGLSTTTVKYIAEYHSREEYHNVRQVVTFSAIFYGTFALCSLPIGWLLAPLVVHALHVPLTLRAEAPVVFVSLLVYVFVTNSASAYGALLAGIGQLRLASYINALAQVVFLGVAVTLAKLHFGIFALVWASWIQTFLSGTAMLVMGQLKIGSTMVWPWNLRRSVVVPLFRLGGWTQLSTLAELLFTEMGRVFIALWAGIDAVSYFEVGSRLTRALRALEWYFYSALLPSASAVAADDTEDRLNTAYVASSRILIAGGTFITGFLVAGASAITLVWLGTGDHSATQIVPRVVIVLALANLVWMVAGTGGIFLRALAQPRTEAITAVGAIIVNLLTVIPLGKHFGLNGILAAMLISAIFGSATFVYVFNRLRRLDFWNSLGRWSIRAIASGIGASSLLWLAIRVIGLNAFGHKAVSFMVLLLLGLAYTVMYVFLLGLLRFLQPSDLALGKRILPERMLAFLDAPAVRLLFNASPSKVA